MIKNPVIPDSAPLPIRAPGAANPASQGWSGEIRPVAALLAMLVGRHEGENAESPANSVSNLQKIRGFLGEMPREDLEGAVITLCERFSTAMAAAREHMVVLAITDFGMHPYQAEKLNLPTMLGSLMGMGLPRIDEGKACSTCAFRQGSCANQALGTVEDALECIGDVKPFMCHEGVTDGTKPIHICRGYAQAMKAINER